MSKLKETDFDIGMFILFSNTKTYTCYKLMKHYYDQNFPLGVDHKDGKLLC